LPQDLSAIHSGNDYGRHIRESVDQTNDQILNNFVFGHDKREAVKLQQLEEEQEQQEEEDEIDEMKAKFN
jgi:hypothetical protein